MMGMPGPTELLILLFLLAAGAVVLLLVMSMRRGGGTSGSEGRDPKEILDERYAQGELRRDEYQQMRRDIEE